MKICLISRKFDRDSGSAEWIYADFLKENLSKKYETFTIEQKGADIKSSRVAKTLYDFFILPSKLLYLRFFKSIKIFHFLSENQAWPCSILNLTGARTIIVFYDLMRVKDARCSLDSKYFSFVYKSAAKARTVVCISTSTKKDLEDFLGRKVNCEIVYPVYRSFKKMKKKKHSKKVIGYLGALDSRKRVGLFAQLAEEINLRKIKGLEIHIWGKGIKYSELKKTAEKHPKILKLRGFAPEEDLERIYNGFDFFVFPSSYEGLGLPIVEASMCGVPCFILKDGYFPKEIKKLCKISKDMPDILNKILNLSQKPKSDLSIFTLERNLRKIESIYKK